MVRRRESLDYATLATAMQQVASGLKAAGVEPGDRIAVYLDKRIEAVLSYFGASYAGAVFVPVNPRLKKTQVAHILDDCSVSVLITTPARAQDLAEAIAACKDLHTVVVLDEAGRAARLPRRLDPVSWNSLIAGGAPDRTAVSRIDVDIAAILYTSGSTGKPRGVVLSHRNLIAGASSVAGYLGNTADDVILAVLPFSFDVGFSQLTTAFSVGASVVLTDYLLARDVVDAAERHGATGLAGVPTLWTQLARLEWPETVIDTLRYVTNTGGAMPSNTLAALRERLPKTDVFLMYGLTEAFRSTFLSPDELDRRPTSIGKAIPNAEILVVRENGTLCEPGEPGELVHRGALVSLGYWNDPESTARRFRPAPNQPDGRSVPDIAVWSGDTVVRDEQGYLYFVGRKDDMIKSSGYRISPAEIEEVVYATGLVDNCAAVGMPDAELGQTIVLVCESTRAGKDTQDRLLAACRAALPSYMVPCDVIFLKTLPCNPNGKIDRREIVAMLEVSVAETAEGNG